MEALPVAVWLALAALLLGPPLLGVQRSAWPIRRNWTTDDAESDAGTTPTAQEPVNTATPVGRCRACGEGGQAGFTYCRSCLTPLPQPEEGAGPESQNPHPAD